MMGESHAVLGAFATAGVLEFMGHRVTRLDDIVPLGLAVALGAVVALLPDIDSPNTMIRRIFKVRTSHSQRRLIRSKNIFAFILNTVRLVIAYFLDILSYFLPHRGPTHWLIVAVGLSAIVWWLCQFFQAPDWVWIAFLTGYVSHLVADGCTRAGVKLFMPFYKKSVKLPVKALRVRTGSWQESISLVVLCLPFIWMIWVY